MKKAFTIFVGFMHDFAAGCWAATVLAVYWLDRIADAGLQSGLTGLKREFFYIGIVCFIIVLIAGAGRTFSYAYIESVNDEDAEKMRKKMLIIKHIILFAVFGSGIWWQWTMTFR